MNALDLFCGAGGASVGLAIAGFDVVGVDIEAQPNYPFTFQTGDAFDADLSTVDFVWASPPCQAHSTATRDKSKHRCFISSVREKLKASGVPYVIENVMGAPLKNPIMLCGAMFGLGVIRHRLFECSFPITAPSHVKHKGSIVTGEYVTVAGNGGVPSWTIKTREKRGLPRVMSNEMKLSTWRRAMGIGWMPRKSLTQAIPPAYSHFIAKEFLRGNSR